MFIAFFAECSRIARRACVARPRMVVVVAARCRLSIQLLCGSELSSCTCSAPPRCYATLGLVVFALFLVLYPFVAALALVLLLLFGWLAGSVMLGIVGRSQLSYSNLCCFRQKRAVLWREKDSS